MNESSKTRLHLSDAERELLRGRVLDIGAGDDPVTSEAVVFDLKQGDANRITAFDAASFDCVYSSHCLEHMRDPVASLDNWWSLVRPGGHLVLVVPDEDLYEQGVFPSRFNSDHKSTFTIAKKSSWSPRSFNVLDLCLALPGARVLSVRLNDIGYDRGAAHHGPAYRSRVMRRVARLYRSLRKRHWVRRSALLEHLVCATLGTDQSGGSALAQIEAVVRRVA
jgi:SAM-dependent methyltransferase